MSAGASLQAALVAALEEIETLDGIYDGPPARARYPYAVVDAREERDWGHKSGEGREVFASVVLWDEGPLRLEGLIDRVEAAVRDAGPIAGWQLVTMQFVKRKVKRDVAGPWAAMVDFRARLLAAG